MTPRHSYFAELAWLGVSAAEHRASSSGPDVDQAVISEGVVIEVVGDRIAAIRSGQPSPPGGAVELPGLTMPGLANGHSHAFHRALRGRTHRRTGSFWTWREQMYSVAGVLDPDGYYALARATYGEMALAGMTSVGEFHYLHHPSGGGRYGDPNAMGQALIAAATDAGIRLTLLDTIYLRGGLDADGAEIDLNDVQRRFCDGGRTAWVERVSALADSPRVKIGAAIHSIRAVYPAAMEDVATWATERDAVVHAHVSEQPAENASCLARYGVTPTRLLAEHGILNERFTAVHATHLVPADVAAYGSAGCICCFCPTTERDLADGIGPSMALHAGGARISLGSDSQAVVDLFEEARAVELDERLISNRRGNHSVVTLASMVTMNGQSSLGWHDAGRLRVGGLADFVTVGLDSVRLSGAPRDDALAAVIFGATAPDIRHVVVGGEHVVRNGAHVRIDVAAELARAIASVTDNQGGGDR
jgi:formiminoglutamate deiminase